MDVLGTYKNEPVILQSKPQRRTISCLYRYMNMEDTYFLQFPYIIFCKYCFDNKLSDHYCRVGFSPEPISSLDATIYLPPLPNIDGIYAACGCGGSNVKKSIERFWQKSFKIGEVFSGESRLCHMFDLLHSESNIDKALRQWEKLDLVSFNERMLGRTSVNHMIAARNFLDISFNNLLVKLTF
jgi:hypothetical protein